MIACLPIALLVALPAWTLFALRSGQRLHHAAYVSVWTDASLGETSHAHRQRVLYAVQASSAALVTLAWACGVAVILGAFLQAAGPEPTADPTLGDDDGAEDASDAMVAP